VASAEDDCGFGEHPVDSATMKEKRRIRSLINAPFHGEKP
jgi:hypothetical protein